MVGSGEDTQRKGNVRGNGRVNVWGMEEGKRGVEKGVSEMCVEEKGERG